MLWEDLVLSALHTGRDGWSTGRRFRLSDCCLGNTICKGRTACVHDCSQQHFSLARGQLSVPGGGTHRGLFLPNECVFVSDSVDELPWIEPRTPGRVVVLLTPELFV